MTDWNEAEARHLMITGASARIEYGEEKERREQRMAEMVAKTGYERGDSRAPIFGEAIMGIWASKENPIRIGQYVETRRRTGKLNPGTYYRLTDGKGKFWEFEANQTLFVSG